MERVVLALMILFFPLPLSGPKLRYWIVWNVGQGEWVTHVMEERCDHFDMGGEKLPTAAIRAACEDKRNVAFFSHWDWDHVGFAARAKNLLPELCLARAPLGPGSPRKQHLFDGWKPCPPIKDVDVWQPPMSSKAKKSANERCQIFKEGAMLVPGDAPAAEEKIYVRTHALGQIRWLVAGHHGSRTSTSKELLQALSNLRFAIASSRRGKYGHPHFETEQRLQLYHVPLLTTEDWGNIRIEE